MKACANPKCSFHFEVSKEIVYSGFISYHEKQLVVCGKIPDNKDYGIKPIIPSMKLHLFNKHENGKTEQISLCDVCNEVYEMFR